jgi:hypothetical protein
MAHTIELSPSARRAFDAMAADFTRVFGDRFLALVVYAPGRAAAFTRAVTPADLDALSALADVWHQTQLATPLVLSADEFRRSLDAFPLEYQAILDRHTVIRGVPPFDGAAVPTGALRAACETQAKGHLIHLRQGWIDAGGHTDDLADRIAHSALPLRALLSNVGRLTGDASGDAAAVARSRFPNSPVLGDVLALETHTAPEDAARSLVARLPEYVTASEAIWAFIDGWRA